MALPAGGSRGRSAARRPVTAASRASTAPTRKVQPATAAQRGWRRLLPPATAPTTPTAPPSRNTPRRRPTTSSEEAGGRASTSCSHPSTTTRTVGRPSPCGDGRARRDTSSRRWVTRASRARRSSTPIRVPTWGSASMSDHVADGSTTCTCNRHGSTVDDADRTRDRRAVVRPLRGRPVRTHVPSEGAQRSGETRWRSGSSTIPSATSAGAPPPATGADHGRWSGRGGSHGERGGSPPRWRWASRTTSTTAGVGPAATLPASASSRREPAGRTVSERPPGRPGARTVAAWNRRSSPSPPRASARPGVLGLMPAAAGSSRTSTESARSRTRKAMRRLTFAWISAVSAPEGRWVARTRCTPSERPSAARRTSPLTKCGTSSTSARSSSMTTTSLGTGSSSGPQSLRWSARSRAPTWAKRRSRRRSSARSDDSARSTRCSSRSVTSPTTCGSAAHRAKAAPPLKSTRTKVSSSGGADTASEVTRVHRNSDFPEPVVPPTSTCGPSRARSIRSGAPPAVTPTAADGDPPVSWRPRVTRPATGRARTRR